MMLLRKVASTLISRNSRFSKESVFNYTRNFHCSPPVSSLGESAKNALRTLSYIKEAPAPAVFYGVSGLIPFTAIPTYMLQTGLYIPEMAYTSMAYSAVILSFIGGIRWGSAVSNPEVMAPNWKNFTLSITPSVLGWISLLVTSSVGSIVAISGFVACLIQDMRCSLYPSWYRSLRILLSTVAICALLVTALCQYLLPLETKADKSATVAN